jgi:hypothetical protein
MQKLQTKLKNVPTDAPQVCSSTNPTLNKVQRLSVQDKVLTCNNLDVDQHQHKGGQDLRVPAVTYVLNQRGRSLMPCSARKARVLLKKGDAHVVRTNPFFVIQLNKATGEQVQECSIGIDSGSKNVGFSVVTDKKEIVAGTLVLDNKTSDRLTERAMYRKGRRNKLWYRKPRFNNRTKHAGWLPPSVQRKFNAHITLINKLKQLLPIKDIVIEVGNFDIQKIENPDIAGVQYQRGSLYEYQNRRSFLMAREHGKCQICGKEFIKGAGSHIHHIIPRSEGGTDREVNLALLHKACHKKIHKKKSNLLKKNKTYKDATFMSIIRSRFREFFPNFKLVYGNETFVNRNTLRLEKTHYNDAFVIAGGNSQTKTQPIILKQKHKNNRVLQCNRKGFKPSIRKQRYAIQPYDIIMVGNKKFTVNGSHNYGKSIVCTDGNKKFDFGIKKVEKTFHTPTICILRDLLMKKLLMKKELIPLVIQMEMAL